MAGKCRRQIGNGAGHNFYGGFRLGGFGFGEFSFGRPGFGKCSFGKFDFRGPGFEAACSEENTTGKPLRMPKAARR